MATQIYFLDENGFLQGQTAVEILPENRKHTTIKPPTNFELPKFEAGRWVEARTVIEKKMSVKESVFDIFLRKLHENDIDFIVVLQGILNANLDNETKTKFLELANETRTETQIKINQIQEL